LRKTSIYGKLHIHLCALLSVLFGTIEMISPEGEIFTFMKLVKISGQIKE